MVDYKDVEPMLRGMWADIFKQIGIEIPKMRGRNSINYPCPLCGGDDRAHWRDEGGRLSLYCRACAVDSMKSPEAVYMEATGLRFNQFIDDMVRFVRYVPIETQTKIKQAYKAKSEPSYCASISADECSAYMSENQGCELVPVQKRVDGALVMCNVAKITKTGIEYAAGTWSHKGFSIIGDGKIAATTPSYAFAKWYADKFDCRVIWALNPENLRDMLCDAKAPVRIVMEWDFDAMCEIEKGNPGQQVELLDMRTGLRASLDSVERLLDGV